MNSGAASLDAFLHAVEVRLPGPGRLREEILAELKDGLNAAAETRERAGLERAQAIRLALQEFGDPELLAASFRPELMVARGRRTAVTLLIMIAIVLALWIAAARSRESMGMTHLFDSPADHVAAGLLVAAVIALGLCTLVTTGRTSGRPRVAPQRSLLTAVAMAALTIICDLAAAAVLTARLAQFPGTLHWLLLGAAIAGSCVGAHVALRAGWSCLAIRLDRSTRGARALGSR
jgi:hypothetical protein